MTPTSDEFEQWAENPITQWVMAGVRRFADLQKANWTETSWAKGEADQARLSELRTRADAYEGLATLTYEQACGLHEDADGQDPA